MNLLVDYILLMVYRFSGFKNNFLKIENNFLKIEKILKILNSISLPIVYSSDSLYSFELTFHFYDLESCILKYEEIFKRQVLYFK